MAGARNEWAVATLGIFAFGCVPQKLVEATRNYGAVSETAIDELAATGDVVTSVCHLRAEIEYLTLSLARVGQSTSFEAFYSTEKHPLPDMAAKLTSTWKQQCNAYRLGDATFTRYLGAVGAYGAALSGFAADDSDAGAPLGELVQGLGDTAATMSVVAAPYKSALASASTPITRVARYAQAQWKAKRIGQLVVGTDADMQRALTALGAYVTTVRSVEVREARMALGDLTASLQSLAAVTASQPSSSLAVDQQFSASFVEVEIEERLREIERRLDSLRDLLEALQQAHSKLALGWKKGKSAQTETLREISALTKRVRQDVQAFEIPLKGAGS